MTDRGVAEKNPAPAGRVVRRSSITTESKAEMGPLELATYRRLLRLSARFRERGDSPEPTQRTAWKAGKGFAALRKHADVEIHFDFKEDVDAGPHRRKRDAPVDAGRVAVELQLSRYFDQRPELVAAIGEKAPTILIDVGDPRTLDRVSHAWREVLFGGRRVVDLLQEGLRKRDDMDVLGMTVRERPNAASLDTRERAALHALSLGLPIFCVSPLASAYVPTCLADAALARIEFPQFDAATIARTIRIVTGRRCGQIPDEVIAGTTVAGLIVAIRFDRTPVQCIEELRRLATAKKAKAGARDLALSDLHGIGEARSWAESSIAEIRDWKAGRIPWSAASSAIALEGPPGCGKTTFAAVYCAEAGLHCVEDANLAAWQSSGDGHLGHLLRAMRKSFEEARANAPSCVFIDEIDSFASRGSLSHSYRDYSVQVVNALLAEIDGIKGREGVVVIGASNDLSRCDPALLRAGRLEKVVRIGIPDIEELERMFRVRLREDLGGEDLRPVAELAAGLVGADVERVVKDARRVSRREGRAMSLRDLVRAVSDGGELDHATRRRAAAHEASHIVADVLLFGPDGVYAVLAAMRNQAGAVVRHSLPEFEGTYVDFHRRLQVVLAGRAGEDMLCGSVSHGAGGRRGGSDLEKGSAIAASMVGSLGLAGRTPLLFLGGSDETKDLLSFAEVRAAANDELVKADCAVRSLLAQHRATLEAVAETLLERGRIDGATVAALVSTRTDVSSDPQARTMHP